MSIQEIILQELSLGWFDTQHAVRAIIRLLGSMLLAAIVGYERERSGKPAGLRTHILVSLGCCLFIMGSAEYGITPEHMSRVVQGIATGIGFIGAGAILKLERQEQIKWLTTAADIWVTAAVGVAVGMGRLGLAALSVLLTWFTLEALSRFTMLQGHKPEEKRTAGAEEKDTSDANEDEFFGQNNP